jgi:hypothetical protein
MELCCHREFTAPLQFSYTPLPISLVHAPTICANSAQRFESKYHMGNAYLWVIQRCWQYSRLYGMTGWFVTNMLERMCNEVYPGSLVINWKGLEIKCGLTWSTTLAFAQKGWANLLNLRQHCQALIWTRMIPKTKNRSDIHSTIIIAHY